MKDNIMRILLTLSRLTSKIGGRYSSEPSVAIVSDDLFLPAKTNETVINNDQTNRLDNIVERIKLICKKLYPSSLNTPPWGHVYPLFEFLE